jgi:hypothetical protein
VFFGVFVFWAVLHRFSILGRLWAFKDVLGFGVGLGLLGVGFGGWLVGGRVAPGGCFVQLLICWVGLGLGMGCFVVETRDGVQPHIPHIYSVARHDQSQVTLQVL